MADLFYRIIEFSIYGSLWILLLRIAARFLKRQGIFWQYMVMFCIACHMLVPVHMQWLLIKLPPAFQISNTTQGAENGQKSDTGQGAENTQNTASGQTDDASAADVLTEQGEQPEWSNEGQTDGKGLAVQPGEAQEKAASQTQAEERSGQQAGGANIRGAGNEGQASSERHLPVKTAWLLLEWLWLFGALFALAGTALEYTAFRKRLLRWQIPLGSGVQDLFDRQKEQYHIKRKIRLICSREVKSPLLCGVIRPLVVLPAEKYSEREYGYIFRHELCHYRRQDIIQKGVFTACCCVYWFHPLVKQMMRRACEMMELLCDDAVLRGEDHEGKQAYSMVILRHAANDSACMQIPLTTGFYGGKEYMKTRLYHIMKSNGKQIGVGAVIITLFVILALGGIKWSTTAAESSADMKNKDAVQTELPQEKQMVDRNILIVGKDMDGKGKISYPDTILYVHVDAKEGMLSVRQVPRSLAVDFDKVAASHPEMKGLSGLGQAEIKEGYMKEGIEGLLAAMEEQYQVEFSSYVVMGYETVREAIDKLGGLVLTLGKKEAKYLNSTNYISKSANRNVAAGEQRLNGDQVMGYLRLRKGDAGSPVVNGLLTKENGEHARMLRAQNVMEAALPQLQKQKLPQDIAELIPEILAEKGDEDFELNLAAKDIISLVRAVVSGELSLRLEMESDVKYVSHHTNGVSMEGPEQIEWSVSDDDVSDDDKEMAKMYNSYTVEEKEHMATLQRLREEEEKQAAKQAAKEEAKQAAKQEAGLEAEKKAADRSKSSTSFGTAEQNAGSKSDSSGSSAVEENGESKSRTGSGAVEGKAVLKSSTGSGGVEGKAVSKSSTGSGGVEGKAVSKSSTSSGGVEKKSRIKE